MASIQHARALQRFNGHRGHALVRIGRPRLTTIRASMVDVAQHTTEGRILGPGVAESWDSYSIGNPVVRCYVGDNEERWFMWYSGSSTTSAPLPGVPAVQAAGGSIGVAVSKDGITWQRGQGAVEGARGLDKEADVGTVLTPNPDWWTFDTAHLGVADVQVLSNSSVSSGVGVYWMFYSGGDFEAMEPPPGLTPPGGSSSSSGSDSDGKLEGLRLRPGLAMSQDGRNWARIEGEHHTGALFDVGPPGSWDALYIAHPQVVAAGPKDIRMYYHSYDITQKKYVIGWASSPDGFQWTKKGVMFSGGDAPSDFDAQGAAACQVVRDVDNKQYLLFYEAVAADGTRSIGLATSKDGCSNWQRRPTPVLQPTTTPGAWDAGGVGAPCAVSMAAGRWRLYYAGRPEKHGAWQGVGLALSAADTPDLVTTTFSRRKPAGSSSAAA